MINIEIGKNEQDQRLDKFLRKYLGNAPLSFIYKAIRKDVKVNGKRAKEDTVLRLGDTLSLYIKEEDLAAFQKKRKLSHARRQFQIAYEDENILAVEKPYGLLTHGDSTEKKNHLTNQVIDYLIEKGDYNPRLEKTFVPAPVNRLDRNTTGRALRKERRRPAGAEPTDPGKGPDSEALSDHRGRGAGAGAASVQPHGEGS